MAGRRLRLAFNFVLAAAGALFLLALADVVPASIAIAASGMGFLLVGLAAVGSSLRRRPQPDPLAPGVPAAPLVLAHPRHLHWGAYGVAGLGAEALGEDGDGDDNGTV